MASSVIDWRHDNNDLDLDVDAIVFVGSTCMWWTTSANGRGMWWDWHQCPECATL